MKDRSDHVMTYMDLALEITCLNIVKM